MVQITCDVCDKAKPRKDKRLGNDLWILGYDIEAENSSGLQRSLRFLSHWDDARVLELGASIFVLRPANLSTFAMHAPPKANCTG